MKRVISALLGVSMASTMAIGLTGCGGLKNLSDQIEQKTGLDKQIADADALRWVCIGDKPADYDAVMAEVNKIVEPELGVKLKLEFIDPAQFTEKTKTQMASHDPVDLYFTGYVNNYQTAVEMKGLYDITDMLDNIKMSDGSVHSMSEVIEQYYLDSATVNGRIYGIPNQQVISNPNCIQINKAVAEECGVDLVGLQEMAINNTNAETSKALMDKMTEELAKIKAKRPDLYTMFPFNPALTNIYEDIAGSVAVRKDDSAEDGKLELVIPTFTEEAKYSYAKINEWYQKGYIRADIASVAQEARTVEDNKKIGMTNTTWKPGQEIYYVNQYGSDPAYAFFQKPYVGRTSPLATMISVGAFSKNPEASVKLIYMLNSNKELYNLICWGIEGKHYVKNADGTATELKDAGYDLMAQNAWKYGNQFNGHIMEGQPASYNEGDVLFNGYDYKSKGITLTDDQIKDVWAQTQTMNDVIADKSPLIGFVPNLTDLQAEIANIKNVNDEYKAKREYGTDPVDSWYNDYIAALKTAGIERVRDELQKQVDAWLASK